MRRPRATTLLALVLLYFGAATLWSLFKASKWGSEDQKLLAVPWVVAAWAQYVFNILDAATRLTAAYALFKRWNWAPAAYLSVVASTGFGLIFWLYEIGKLVTGIGLFISSLFAVPLYLGWRIAKPLWQERSDAL